MPIKLERNYMVFYLEGRRAGGKAFDPTIDLDLVAERVLKTGETPHQALLETVTDAAKSLEVGPERQAWIDKRARKLKGLDPDVAYRHYTQGLIDDCVAELDVDDEDGDDGILCALDAALEDEEDDDEDEDEEDDDDD